MPERVRIFLRKSLPSKQSRACEITLSGRTCLLPGGECSLIDPVSGLTSSFLLRFQVISPRSFVDCIYIAAASHDSRFTRICVASIRYFYPEVPIRFLVGGRVRRELLDEVRNLYGVQPAPMPPGEYGWGFIKLEPLFESHRERFLVLDSDTVLLGPVLETIETSRSDFMVDSEQQSEECTKQIYYDWEALQKVDLKATRPEFLFNTGQWFGRSGVLTRADFGHWVEWSLPRRLTRPDLFKNGEQGLLNYVVNEKAHAGTLSVNRVPLMRWPGHNLGDIALAEVARGPASPYRQIVHWAGFKAARLETLPRADLLLHFERLYYQRHGGGEPLRQARARRYAWEYRGRQLRQRVLHRFAKMRAPFATS